MADNELSSKIIDCFDSAERWLSLSQIQHLLTDPVAERTLRRHLQAAVSKGLLVKKGEHKARRYALGDASTTKQTAQPLFLSRIPRSRREALLKQIRDLWTHTSTAIEGNTLTLGDTHFILEQGLTISGKSLREHQEILGHARAIDIIYRALNQPIDETLLFSLHKAVQTEIIYDTDKPYGDWKRIPNGTYTVDRENRPIFLEYALPQHVPHLMSRYIQALNEVCAVDFTDEQAIEIYAKFHAAFVHIHPFWDGNGRLARLVANIPLLRAGLPPLLIRNEKRRQYIEILSAYETESGQLSDKTSLWPVPELLERFIAFCRSEYQQVFELLREHADQSD